MRRSLSATMRSAPLIPRLESIVLRQPVRSRLDLHELVVLDEPARRNTPMPAASKPIGAQIQPALRAGSSSPVSGRYLGPRKSPGATPMGRRMEQRTRIWAGAGGGFTCTTSTCTRFE